MRDDVPGLRTLMGRAIAELQRGFLSEEQIHASHAIMGLDTQLIDDRTYFIVESDGTLAGCGGWSRRATLFGGDHSAGRDAALLDPTKDATRVRAMYTAPEFARRGVGRLILGLCEDAAAAHGFARVELAATLAGVPLYRACGYSVIERMESDTPQGVRVPLLRMGKSLAGFDFAKWRNWLSAQAGLLRAAGHEVEFAEGTGTKKPSFGIGVVGKNTLADFTTWSTGETDWTVLRKTPQSRIPLAHRWGAVLADADYEEAFDAFRKIFSQFEHTIT